MLEITNMRKVISLLSLLTILACSSTVPVTAENSLDHHQEQTTDLVGQIDRQALSDLSWYKKNYSSYTPEQTSLEALQDSLNDIEIKVFMGTWCHDSKRETPRLFKILDKLNYNLSSLSLVALDYSKSTPDGFEDGLDIQRTPTFVFFKNGEEVGRIVETPRESLEQDILKIVTSQEYKHSYQD